MEIDFSLIKNPSLLYEYQNKKLFYCISAYRHWLFTNWKTIFYYKTIETKVNDNWLKSEDSALLLNFCKLSNQLRTFFYYRTIRVKVKNNWFRSENVLILLKFFKTIRIFTNRKIFPPYDHQKKFTYNALKRDFLHLLWTS